MHAASTAALQTVAVAGVMALAQVGIIDGVVDLELEGGVLVLVVDAGIGGAELGRHSVSPPEGEDHTAREEEQAHTPQGDTDDEVQLGLGILHCTTTSTATAFDASWLFPSHRHFVFQLLCIFGGFCDPLTIGSCKSNF